MVIYIKNSMKNLIIPVVLISLLIGCGEEHKTVETIKKDIKINNVELGPIQGANIRITTLDTEQLLYSTVTNSRGQYEIDINEFSQNLKELSTAPKYILISATNGLDIDPEDDGDTTNSSPIVLNGTVKGIFKTSTLQNNGNLSINLISTAISEILKDKKEINDEKISYVAKELGASDINNDGIINNKDIYLYRMSEHETNLEKILREEFLGAIHNGNNSQIENITNELREQYNLMFISYSISNSVAILSIENSKENSKIMYKLNANKDENLSNIYISPINLEKNDYIVYKECISDNCSVTQIVSFDGEKIYQFFLKISDFTIHSDLKYMNELRAKIVSKKELLDNITSRLNELKTKN